MPWMACFHSLQCPGPNFTALSQPLAALLHGKGLVGAAVGGAGVCSAKWCKIDLDDLAKAQGGGITFPLQPAPLQQSSCCRARCSSQAFACAPPTAFASSPAS